ncbi:hypothetical protein [Salinarimonas chemoclinalis]|uniref:hypothetical protein n=1 Tax=Salinarimonas chemoclinalis TaxID=3241599 RepID=UPI003555C9C9
MSLETETTPTAFRVVEPNGGRPSWTWTTWRGPAPNLTARVRIAGLCRSDLKEAFGNRDVRRDFGHELVAEIVGVPLESGLAPGQRVVLDPHVEIRRSTGFARVMHAYAEPATLARAFLPVSDEMPDRIAVFAEPLACAVHSVRQALGHYRETGNETPPRRVAFTAAGLASLLQAFVLARSGIACEIFNRSPERLAVLRSRAALARTGISLREAEPESAYDIVVVSGAFSDEVSIERAWRMVRPDGVLLLFGGTKSGEYSAVLGLPTDALRRNQARAAIARGGKRAVVAGTHGARREDFTEALRLLALPDAGSFFTALVDRIVRVEELPALLLGLHHGEIASWSKTLVETRADGSDDTRGGVAGAPTEDAHG